VHIRRCISSVSGLNSQSCRCAFSRRLTKTHCKCLYCLLLGFFFLFICAYKAWVISPPCPHPLPYHPLRPVDFFFFCTMVYLRLSRIDFLYLKTSLESLLSLPWKSLHWNFKRLRSLPRIVSRTSQRCWTLLVVFCLQYY
jgi:hypothetical protein